MRPAAAAVALSLFAVVSCTCSGRSGRVFVLEPILTAPTGCLPSRNIIEHDADIIMNRFEDLGYRNLRVDPTENGILVRSPRPVDDGLVSEVTGRRGALTLCLVADERLTYDALKGADDKISGGGEEAEGSLLRNVRTVEGDFGVDDTGYSTFRQLLDGARAAWPEGYGFLFGPGEVWLQQTVRRLYMVRSDPEMTCPVFGDVRASPYSGSEPGMQNTWVVSLTFASEDAAVFAQVTGGNIGRRLAIVLDSVVISAPVIQARIPNGSCMITTNSVESDDAGHLAVLLRTGMLRLRWRLESTLSASPRGASWPVVAGALVALGIVSLSVLMYRRVRSRPARPIGLPTSVQHPVAPPDYRPYIHRQEEPLAQEPVAKPLTGSSPLDEGKRAPTSEAPATPTSDFVACTACGSRNEYGARFCHSCGGRMSDTVSSRADTTGWNVQSMPPEWCPSVPSEGTPYVAASRPGYDEAKDRPRSAGTKLFNVYANETGGCEAVKVGWSWPAFSFGAFWALYKRMWGIGLGVLLTWFVLTLAGTIVLLSQAVNSLAVVGGMAGWFVFGSYGNKWRARHLLARGFTLRGTISASSARQAATLYSDGALSAPAPSSNSTDAEGKTA